LVSKGEHHAARAALGGFIGGGLPILGAPAAGAAALAAGAGAVGGYAGEASSLPEYIRYLPYVGRYGEGYQQKRKANLAQHRRPIHAPIRITITRAARQMLIDYLERAPEVGETHPVDPLSEPREFFLEELHEPDHWLVLKRTLANDGQVTPKIMGLWIAQSMQRHGLRTDDLVSD
jgi:hypothetical protein